MTSMLQSFWTGALRPFFQRPPALQVAALCHRQGKDGVEVMLVTSSSGRWILPKGWPIDGLSAAQVARQEAWEEGGLKKGTPKEIAIGSFLAEKRFDTGAVVPCETRVYPIDTAKTVADYPEADRRDRIWVSPNQAATMVDEPGLQEILLNFRPV